MRKTYIFMALFFITITSAQEVASYEKMKYLLTLSGLNSLTDKTREYLYLTELKKNKDLIPKKNELKKVIDSYYSNIKMEEILITDLQKKFSAKEINKLIAIFETNEMKKMISIQPDIIKSILKDEQSRERKDLQRAITEIK